MWLPHSNLGILCHRQDYPREPIVKEPTPGATPVDLAAEAVAGIFSAAILGAITGFGAQAAFDALAGTEGLQDLARFLVGGLAGLVIGAPLGPWAVARFRGRRFRLLAGWAGALAGAIIAVLVISVMSSTGAASYSGLIALLLVVFGAVMLGGTRTRRG